MKARLYRFIGCIILQSTLLHAQPSELIMNGDFSSGNTAFTSDYLYCNEQNCLYPEGYYAVGVDPTYFHSDFYGTDHSTGTGNLMIVNGSVTLNANIWCETIPVSSNVTYTFSYWLSSLVTATPAMLQVNVNGIPAGGVFNAPSEIYMWEQFSVDWYSGDNTSASICIVNQNTAPGGNDFGLDDISFKSTVCPLPANLSASNITSSSAKIKWDAVAEALRYKLRYKVAGSNAWTTITNISSTSKKISDLLPGTSYTCQVKSVCSANPIVSSGWSSSQTFTTGPLRIGNEALEQVSFSIYPNPAEDHAAIQFTLPESSHIYIKVYDMTGKEIVVLLNDELQQGDHSLQINTNQFSKGVYLVKMISDLEIVRGTPYGENQKLIVQ